MVRAMIFDAFPKSTQLAWERPPRALGEVWEVAVVRGAWVVLGAPWRFSASVLAPDVGPCALCRRPGRHRYGEWGGPLCAECGEIL